MAMMNENGNGLSGQNTNGNRAQYHLYFVCELCGSSHPSKWERWLHVSSVHPDEPSIRVSKKTSSIHNHKFDLPRKLCKNDLFFVSILVKRIILKYFYQ